MEGEKRLWLADSAMIAFQCLHQLQENVAVDSQVQVSVIKDLSWLFVISRYYYLSKDVADSEGPMTHKVEETDWLVLHSSIRYCVWKQFVQLALLVWQLDFTFG